MNAQASIIFHLGLLEVFLENQALHHLLMAHIMSWANIQAGYSITNFQNRRQYLSQELLIFSQVKKFNIYRGLEIYLGGSTLILYVMKSRGFKKTARMQ